MTSQPATTQVVHLDFISLAASATESAVADLISEAAALASLDHVLKVGVIQASSEPWLLTHGEGAQSSEEAEVAPSPSRESAGLRVGPPSSPSAPSDFDLAFFFVVDSFTFLEPFGTHPAYIAFLQGKVARILKGFAGADISLDASFPHIAPYAACLALAAPDQTYDWEVRATLASASDSAPSRALGLAIGERQRYRGCVLTFTDAPTILIRPEAARYQTSLIAGAVRQLS